MKVSHSQKKVIAIIPAAGIGKRFGTGTNKLFQKLAGKPLFVWSIEILEDIPDVIEIIPVLKEEDSEKGRKIFEAYSISKIKKIIPGGKERQDSVYNGLKFIEDKKCLVLIHDGARPLIEKKQIKKMIKDFKDSTLDHDGLVFGVPLKDTIKESKDGIITKTLKRDSLWAIQTPQVFPYETIFSAYDKAMKEGFYSTDDAALIERYGGSVKVIMGSYRNIKITTPEDLIVAELFLNKCVQRKF